MTQDLAALVDAAGPEELIALIGQLEAARALAWARLNHGPGFCVPPGEVQDRLLTMTDALVDQAGWGVGICEGRPERSSALGWGRFERLDEAKPIAIVA